MTRRDRLTAKLDKRQEWAEKATVRSEQAFASAHELADRIPLGQPILVSHHSEGRALRDAERIESRTVRGIEESRLAKHHASKADGLASQLDKTIFSDDEDAVAALEARIVDNERTCQVWAGYNKAWRQAKGDVTEFARLAGMPAERAASLAENVRRGFLGNTGRSGPFQLTSLRARIRTDRERLEQIEAQQARVERAIAAGGVVVEGGEYVRVTFAEKPARAILDALHAAGYSWGGGSWVGRRANLPAGIEEAPSDHE